jgi:hypothetical protein
MHHLTRCGERTRYRRTSNIWALAQVWHKSLPRFINFERINCLALSYLPWHAPSATSKSAFISNVRRSTIVRRLELQGLTTTRSNRHQIIHAFPPSRSPSHPPGGLGLERTGHPHTNPSFAPQICGPWIRPSLYIPQCWIGFYLLSRFPTSEPYTSDIIDILGPTSRELEYKLSAIFFAPSALH